MCGKLARHCALTFLWPVLLGCGSEPLDSGDGASAPSGEGRIVSVVVPEGDAVPAPPPEYPEGPYGTAVGATIANLSFLGWRDPVASAYDETALEVVRLSDFYNPGGAKNDVRVIVLNASAVWCSVCRAEYSHLARDGIYEEYRPKGIEIVGVLFEDNSGAPARPRDLALWGNSDSGFAVPFPLVLDPGFKTGVYFSADATPLNMIIDATTMEILNVTMGFDAISPEAYWAAIEEWLDG